MVEAMPNGLVVTNQQGKILLVNSQIEKLFGYRREELLGQSVEVLVPEAFRERHPEFRRRFLVDPQTRPMGAGRHLYGRRKDGKLVPVEVGLGPIKAQENMWIVSSIIDITERKRAEEYRFRHAAIVESSEDAIISKTLEGVITSWNAGAQKMFGYTEEEAIGQPITMIIPPELRGEEHDILRQLRDGKRINHFETVRVSNDGNRINVSITVSPVRDATGGIIGASKIARDITKGKKAEAALRESEERFRLMANTAPVMIWMAAADKSCSYANQHCAEFIGQPAEELLGNGWTESIHSDDLARCWDTYGAAFDHHRPFQMEYRLRRHDGEFRWVISSGVPRFGADGSFAGYIGSGIDITDRKLAEEALSSVSGRLIEAQDEERRRVARELHDDVSQQMALLQIGLEQFDQEETWLSSKALEKIHDLTEIADKVSSNIHDLSHRLHPSRLDVLGLLPSLAGVCSEFSKIHHLPVQFAHHDIPEEISKDVTLCLFRIAQEALRNVVKHSGAAQAQVELLGLGNRIELCVLDTGVGFDPESVKGGQGIGLVSMRERLRLIGGDLTVESVSPHGTRIRARAPLIATGGTSKQQEILREANLEEEKSCDGDD